MKLVTMVVLTTATAVSIAKSKLAGLVLILSIRVFVRVCFFDECCEFFDEMLSMFVSVYL
jgi:pentatricopeptide repeat protein